RSRRPLRIALVACERRCTTPPNNGGRYQPGRWPPASEHPCASGPPASQDRREHSRQTADRRARVRIERVGGVASVCSQDPVQDGAGGHGFKVGGRFVVLI